MEQQDFFLEITKQTPIVSNREASIDMIKQAIRSKVRNGNTNLNVAKKYYYSIIEYRIVYVIDDSAISYFRDQGFTITEDQNNYTISW